MASEYPTNADNEFTLWKKYLINQSGPQTPSANDNLMAIIRKILINTVGPEVPYQNDNYVSILRKICINKGGSPFINWNDVDYIKCIARSGGATIYQNDGIISILKGLVNGSVIVVTGNIIFSDGANFTTNLGNHITYSHP